METLALSKILATSFKMMYFSDAIREVNANWFTLLGSSNSVNTQPLLFIFLLDFYKFFLLMLLKATYRHAVLKKKGYWAYYSDFPSHLLSTLKACFHFSGQVLQFYSLTTKVQS